ncbi:MAG: polyprenyl synthetase family protein [Proteobacteria bacterium]|nr:polyprenyl synthetase family protein [Pseudomonadota bacterium]
MSKTETFAAWLSRCSMVIENRLTELLSQLTTSPLLLAAMRDSTLAGGKRLRPAVLFAVAEQNNTLPAAAVDAACALELIHCYSLVHDDMPCMDDDATRRGRPACHKAHGEGMALLTGDCLQSLAFATLANTTLPLQAVAHLAQAAGANGMGGGQAFDISGQTNSEEQLETMHRMKTGALFECALQLGLICRSDNTRPELLQAINVFSHEFGLLFQIANDLSDEQQDRHANKPTYATLFPRAETEQKAAMTKTRALNALDELFPRLTDITHAVYS